MLFYVNDSNLNLKDFKNVSGLQLNVPDMSFSIGSENIYLNARKAKRILDIIWNLIKSR